MRPRIDPTTKKPAFTGADPDLVAAAQAAWSRLNHKRRLFCIEYLVDCNGTRAAMRAGYSKATARTQAAQLLAILDVQDVVAGLVAGHEKRARLTFDERLAILAEIATAKHSRYWHVAGAELDDAREPDLDDLDEPEVGGDTLRPPRRPPSIASLSLNPQAIATAGHDLAGLKFSEHHGESGDDYRVEIKQHDKIAAIREYNEMLGDHAPRRVRVEDITGLAAMSDAELERIVNGEKPAHETD